MNDTARTIARPIRVLHLLHSVAYGGVETVVLNWLRCMDRERFAPELVCFANPGGTERPFVAAAERLGFEVAAIPWSRSKPFLRCARMLSQRVRERRIDILHTHNTYADCVGALVKRATGVKALTTLYVWADLGWKRNLLQRLNLYAIRGFERVTAHCGETHRRSLALGIPEHKLRTLVCGFDRSPVHLSEAERLRRRRSLGIGDDTILLAYVARFYPEKAHDRLLLNFENIRRKAPRCHLWLVGVGPLEEELRRRASALGLDGAVTFTGFFEDLLEKLPLLDLQVHPSDMEGVALAICSGMASGLPLVCTDVGGVSEVIHDGKTGLLVPHGDDPAFVEAVLRLVRDPSLRARLGAGARHFIEHDYSLARATREVERTYHEMMDRCG